MMICDRLLEAVLGFPLGRCGLDRVTSMRCCVIGILITMLFTASASSRQALGATGRMSEDTEFCIECHASLHPGIVNDWKRSRMAQVTPHAAKNKDELEQRVSYREIPGELAFEVVGCAECHTMSPEEHPDTFEHNGYQVHVVVTPRDCATCHPVEADQYGRNLMSHAHFNLENNPLYKDLSKHTNGLHGFADGKVVVKDPDADSLADSCFYCHGTDVRMLGTASRETDYGEMEFPVLSGWPNQGTGRVNPDGSKGTCSACHTRHGFSIRMARKPYTCSQCHKGPDVPAFKVYSVSKHGNIFAAMGESWDYEAVPWSVGKHFSSPTCAVCHVSLVVSEEGGVVANRTHQMNDRLPWRIFGLVYAHPHPRSPDTAIIRNRAGLPLPTELTGEPAVTYLIDQEDQQKRRQTMRGICIPCHSEAWADGHFERLENTIRTSNDMTLTATKVLLSAWEKGMAKGLVQEDSIFNETIERRWVEQWLFFANSTRYASAMLGGDYGVFDHGRWYLSRNILEMADEIGLDQDELGP
jgi:hypothetical protein